MPTLFNGSLELPPAADMHVHVRDGAMLELVAPTIHQGGVDTVFVMPNLVPPVTTVEACLAYKARIQKALGKDDVTLLMSLYLHPDITPETIKQAAEAGITGVKSYPAGLTTNSDQGVVDYESFYPVFAAMQKYNLTLNLHGEAPSSTTTTVLNAEKTFLPTLLSLHAHFPTLRIILEHCTTASAIAAVRSCGPTVAATITAHHLVLTIDDWCGDVFNFCKPVAKLPEDRSALLHAVVSGQGKFFFGSDSAPHPIAAKRGGAAGASGIGKTAAGCFTQMYGPGIVLAAVEKAVEKGWVEAGEVAEEALRAFLCGNGRKFYQLPEAKGGKGIVLEKKGERIEEVLRSRDGTVEVVHFGRGEEVWSARWA